jgi:hypothetical protein
MLQLLLLDVLKIDQVLHMRCAWEAADDVDDIWSGMGDVRSSACDVRGGAGPLLVRSLGSMTR